MSFIDGCRGGRFVAVDDVNGMGGQGYGAGTEADSRERGAKTHNTSMTSATLAQAETSYGVSSMLPECAQFSLGRRHFHRTTGDVLLAWFFQAYFCVHSLKKKRQNVVTLQSH